MPSPAYPPPAPRPGPAADATGVETMLLLGRLGAPRAVKTAAARAVTSGVWRDWPAVAYADCHAREPSYPVYTPEAALASAAFVLQDPHADPAVRQGVKRACARFGLAAAHDKLAARAAAVPATGTTTYALPAPDGSGGRYPLGTPELRKAAAEYFREYRDAFAEPERVAYATNLLAASGPDEHDRATRVLLEKAAGEARGGVSRTEAAAALESHVRAPDGSWYLLDDLRRVPVAALVAGYGTPPVASADKRAALLQEHGARFQSFLADFGVHPVVRPPVAAPKVDWVGLAAGAPG